LARVQVKAEADVAAVDQQRRSEQNLQFRHDEAAAPTADPAARQAPEGPETYVRDGRKVGRNEPCPCGSGQKYKQCHGKLT